MFWPAYLVAATAVRMLLAKVRLLQKHYLGWSFDGNFQGCHSYHVVLLQICCITVGGHWYWDSLLWRGEKDW